MSKKIPNEWVWKIKVPVGFIWKLLPWNKGRDADCKVFIRYVDDDFRIVEDISGDFDSYGLDGTPIAGSNYAGTTTAAAGPIDQRSTSFGVGLDVRLSKSSGLYIRHKRFTQKDENFVQDDISGTETTIELKVFF